MSSGWTDGRGLHVSVELGALIREFQATPRFGIFRAKRALCRRDVVCGKKPPERCIARHCTQVQDVKAEPVAEAVERVLVQPPDGRQSHRTTCRSPSSWAQICAQFDSQKQVLGPG
jgi:hypothetical protein